jgi:predicted Fe-Mo cluster-binding NifX family protein
MLAHGLLYAKGKGGGSEMKIAFTVWENRISPAFDFARLLLIAEVNNGTVTTKYHAPFHSELAFSRAAELADMQVEVVICGAISQPLSNMIEGYGIRIVPFVTGEVNRVLDAYLKGSLSKSDIRMPGRRRTPQRRSKGKHA